MRRLLAPLTLALPLALGACAEDYGEADVTGALGEFGFGEELTAYHGTRHIVIVDRHMDCLDMSWVTRNYFGSEPAESNLEFAAFQFTFDAETPETGNFSLEADGAVRGWGLINANVPADGVGEIEGETSEEGFLQVDEVTEESITGSFGVVISNLGNGDGTFITTHCRNVR